MLCHVFLCKNVFFNFEREGISVQAFYKLMNITYGLLCGDDAIIREKITTERRGSSFVKARSRLLKTSRLDWITLHVIRKVFFQWKRLFKRDII